MLPNFLILEAAKSGTSSLYRYLAQHPDIFMSRFKEPTFFVWADTQHEIRGPGVGHVRRQVIRDLDSYRQLFSEAKEARVRGEASTGYLHTPGVAERIQQYVPEAKLIAILRNPIDRAYSAFLHARRAGFEPLADFQQALEEEPRRIRDRWIGLTLYTTLGMYAEQLDRYLAVFPTEQIRVYLFDDLVRDRISVAQDAFRFLEVDQTFEPDVSKRANVGRVQNIPLSSLRVRLRKNPLARRVVARSLRRLHLRMTPRAIEDLSPTVRLNLSKVFESDVMRLSAQLERNLSPWLEAEGNLPPQREQDVGRHPRRVRMETK